MALESYFVFSAQVAMEFCLIPSQSVDQSFLQHSSSACWPVNQTPNPE
jgi:hypothetical protein